jgi:hypothetical protein
VYPVAAAVSEKVTSSSQLQPTNDSLAKMAGKTIADFSGSNVSQPEREFLDRVQISESRILASDQGCHIFRITIYQKGGNYAK